MLKFVEYVISEGYYLEGITLYKRSLVYKHWSRKMDLAYESVPYIRYVTKDVN